VYCLSEALRRSKLEIYVDILKTVAVKPLKPTQITSKAKINFKTSKNYLNPLTQYKLIQKQTIKKRKRQNSFYSITKKGIAFLKLYNKILLMVHPKKSHDLQNYFL